MLFLFKIQGEFSVKIVNIIFYVIDFIIFLYFFIIIFITVTLAANHRNDRLLNASKH